MSFRWGKRGRSKRVNYTTGFWDSSVKSRGFSNSLYTVKKNCKSRKINTNKNRQDIQEGSLFNTNFCRNPTRRNHEKTQDAIVIRSRRNECGSEILWNIKMTTKLSEELSQRSQAKDISMEEEDSSSLQSSNTWWALLALSLSLPLAFLQPS